jgi:Ca-activated chloride channel family protein
VTFANPHILWLLALVPIWAIWIWWRDRRHDAGLQYSSVAIARTVPRTIWTYLERLPLFLRTGALILGILALARPQEVNQRVERHTEGVDIMMVLDISTSMRAQDFEPNRFEAAREVAAEFIDNRSSDRIGLIVFAAEAFTQTPLTVDYDFLQRMMDRVEIGMINDGTAIGTALATAVNRLKNSEADSKVIILLTDGQNNQGQIDPTTAAEVAETMGVRVYPIGVGSHGSAPYAVDRPFGGQRQVQIPVRIDEEMLTTVANTTHGKYFRATDKTALRTIYDEIGSLEQTEIEEEVYTDYRERYATFAWPALLLVLLDVLLRTTRLRRFP